MDQECSAECQAVLDATLGMPVDELSMELETSGRFQDPMAVAAWLASGGEPPDAEVPGDDEPVEEPLE